ncbi:MAG: methyltransferase domain-containing protein [Ignavibacteria bacterium]|nr:methyltransferase domain-containing protein [Ignavibacteria bacterium]
MEINDIIICPNCKSNLQIKDRKYFCDNCNSSYEIVSDIPVLISHQNSISDIEQKNLADYFDSKYAKDEDPWDYESSAAEKMKYEFVTNLVKKLNPNANTVLDVACSFGYLSNKLSDVSKEVIGIDVSLHALMKANEKYKKENIKFISAGAENIPFKDKTFDAVILCDGLNGMDLTGVHRKNAVKESLRVLNETGFTIFTDYLKPNQFEGYIDYIKKSDYVIKDIYYLNDRLWYKLKYSFNAFKDSSILKKFLSSMSAGKALSKISSLFGKSGSNHICIVASRK